MITRPPTSDGPPPAPPSAPSSGVSRRYLIGGGLVIGLVTVATSASAWWWRDDGPEQPVRELGWGDLVPADFVPAPDPTVDMTDAELDQLFDGSADSNLRLQEIDEAMRYAPTDPSLDGQHVTLPGYVVPLDFDGQTRMEEFLLVPYFGACIHTPPPPANQIVMAKLDRPTEVGDGYEPVRLRGILRTEQSMTNLAETGYTMEVLSIDPVERP